MPRRVCYVCWYRFRRLVLGTDDRELYCYFEFENDGWFSDVFEACPRFRSSRDESIDLKAQHAFDFDFWQYRNQQQTTKIICRWSYRVFAIVGLFFWTLKEITVQNETCRIEYRADTVRQVTRVGIVRAHTFYTKKCSRTKRKKKTMSRSRFESDRSRSGVVIIILNWKATTNHSKNDSERNSVYCYRLCFVVFGNSNFTHTPNKAMTNDFRNAVEILYWGISHVGKHHAAQIFHRNLKIRKSIAHIQIGKSGKQ